MRDFFEIKGFLIAPVIPALLILLFIRAGGLEFYLFSFTVGYLYGLLFLSVLGLPAVFVLVRTGTANWFSITVAGVVIGLVFCFIVVERLRGFPNLEALLISSLQGMTAATTYYFFLARKDQRGPESG